MTASADPTAAIDAPRPRVPDFFIVGHLKCGTTALYSMLARHPQVFMPGMKEPRFLASDMRDRFFTRAMGRTPDTLEDYLALFARAKPEQRAGEASPIYLTSHTAAAAIAELQPDARIIAILREPASFLRSLHLQLVQGHVESEKDLRSALALEPERRAGKRVPRLSHRPNFLFYSEHVRYVEQLRRYRDVFSEEQILVLIYDDFRQDNEATMRRVLRFLEVDDAVPLVPRDINPTVGVRAPTLFRMVHAVTSMDSWAARAIRASAGALAPKRLTHKSLVAMRDRIFLTDAPPPDERLMLELRRRFKGEVVALSEYIGRDLVSLWGYEDVD